MALKNWVRRLSAFAAWVCIAIVANGCSVLNIRVASHARSDASVLLSKPVSTPTSEILYSAELSADPGQPIAVRASRQAQCKLTEHHVFDRTIVTKTEPAGTKLGPLVGVLGGAGVVWGLYWGVSAAAGTGSGYSAREVLQLSGHPHR